MFQRSLLLAVLFVLASSVLPQTISEPAKPEEAEKLEKEAVVFLRETLADINGMRTMENRISFTSELASLMWFHDEREARAMFVGVIGDFKQLLLQYDTQMNAYGIGPGEELEGGGFFIGDPTERQIIERKFRAAIGVRQAIATSLAEHDAELAFSFYYESLSSVSNPEFRKQLETRDSYLEFELINRIADKNAAKAVQFGKRSIEKGVNYQHLELLKKIYAKDPDKAAEFAASILSRLKSEKFSSVDFWVASSLLSFGAELLDKSRAEGGKKAIFTQSELRDLAEVFAQALLTQPDLDVGPQYADQIGKYLPGRAAQIRAKFKIRAGNANSRHAYSAVANAMNTAANVSYSQSRSSNSISNSNSVSARDREQQAREQNEKQMMGDVLRLGDKQVSKEQRANIISEARKILLAVPGREKKITGLGILAAQVAKAGEKELAAEIMKDAHNLVSSQPKTYQDFLLIWMLATGYASVDTDKAFPLLEDTISRANDTLAAFVKVAEFIDVGGEMIQDGEVQVGAFGGSMVRGLTRELAIAESTIRILAAADFQKTKNLTNNFERPEVRVLAKMMVLRTVLDKSKREKADGASGAEYEDH